MCQSGRNPELAAVLGGQNLAHPCSIGWGLRADVDRYVKDRAGCDPHQLALRLFALVMQPAQHMFGAFGVVVLDKLHIRARGLGQGARVEALVKKAPFIATVENRQGLKVAAPEEIAWRSGWIDDAQLQALARPLAKTGYGAYLLRLLQDKVF